MGKGRRVWTHAVLPPRGATSYGGFIPRPQGTQSSPLTPGGGGGRKPQPGRSGGARPPERSPRIPQSLRRSGAPSPSGLRSPHPHSVPRRRPANTKRTAEPGPAGAEREARPSPCLARLPCPGPAARVTGRPPRPLVLFLIFTTLSQRHSVLSRWNRARLLLTLLCPGRAAAAPARLPGVGAFNTQKL